MIYMTVKEESKLFGAIIAGREASQSPPGAKGRDAKIKAGRDASERVAESCMNLALHFASRFRREFSRDPDAALSAAHLGLTQAINAFDPSQGVRFVTFASACILNSLKLLQKTRSAIASKRTVVGILGAENEDVSSEVPDPFACEPFEALSRDELRRSLFASMSLLDQRSRRVIGLLYFTDERRTWDQVAKILGISKQYVGMIVAKARPIMGSHPLLVAEYASRFPD